MAIQLLARLLTPESAILAGSERLRTEEVEAINQAAKVLRPGDIILTQTPGNVYETLRTFAGHDYDHAVRHMQSVVIDTGKCLHIGPPAVRIVPLSHFLSLKRKPVVLRPKLSPSATQEYLRNLTHLIGRPYDYMKVVLFWAARSVYERIGTVLPVRQQTTNKVICSEAIVECIPNAKTVLNRYKQDLDYGKLNAVSISDLLVLYEKGEMTLVRLPLPYSTYPILTPSLTSLLTRFARRQLFNLALVRAGWSVAKFMETLKGKRYKVIILAIWLLQRYALLMNVPYFSRLSPFFTGLYRLWPKL